MELIAILLSLITLVAVAFLVVKLNQPAKQNQGLDLVQQQMEGIRNQVSQLYQGNQTILQKVNTDMTQTLENVQNNMGKRLDNAALAVKDVHRRLGEVQEANKRIHDIGKDIASLQDILRAPKIRGGMGELFLSQLLDQIFPKSYYELQYSFKSREVVDAVIKLNNRLVSVDSKFPLENFKKIMAGESEAEIIQAKKQFIRDVKKHIDAIAKKYILPDENTFDFALMYIPAENVYYETIIKDENIDEEKGLFQYAIAKKVLPVSPNSFYAYLQTILLGLRGMKIEAQAEDILKNLNRLTGDFGRISDDFTKMGTHIKNLTSAYESTDKRLGRFGDKLESLEEKEIEVLPLTP